MVDSVSLRFKNARVEKMPLSICIQWSAGTACVSECVLKSLACRGLRVDPSKGRNCGLCVPQDSMGCWMTVSMLIRWFLIWYRRTGCHATNSCQHWTCFSLNVAPSPLALLAERAVLAASSSPSPPSLSLIASSTPYVVTSSWSSSSSSSSSSSAATTVATTFPPQGLGPAPVGSKRVDAMALLAAPAKPQLRLSGVLFDHLLRHPARHGHHTSQARHLLPQALFRAASNNKYDAT